MKTLTTLTAAVALIAGMSIANAAEFFVDEQGQEHGRRAR